MEYKTRFYPIIQGDKLEGYQFDCPHCKKYYADSTIETNLIHNIPDFFSCVECGTIFSIIDYSPIENSVIEIISDKRIFSCESCKKAYTNQLIIPDDYWNKISKNRLTHLCGSCIMSEIEKEEAFTAFSLVIVR